MKIVNQYLKFSIRENCENILFLILESEDGKKYVMGGNVHFPSEVVEYEKCWYFNNN